MKRKMCKGLQKIGMAMLTMLFLAAPFTMTVYAAEADVHFGSEGYEPEYGVDFPIGVYLQSEDTIGAYEITLHYDTRFLEYVSGATEGGDGTISVNGDLQGTSIRYMLHFRVLAAGDTSLTVAASSVMTGDGTEGMSVAALPEAPIHIVPNWESAVTGIRINGAEVADFVSGTMSYDITLPYAEAFDAEADGGTVTGTELVEVSDLEKIMYLSVDDGNQHVGIYTMHLMLEEPEEEQPPAQEEPSVGDSPVAGGANAENLQQGEEVQQNEEMQEVSPDDVKETVAPNIPAKRGIDKSIFVVIGMLALLFAVMVITGIKAYKNKVRMSAVYMPDDGIETNEEIEFEPIDERKIDK